MNPFYTVDGKVIHDLGELARALPTMSQETFSFHVTEEKNDFANWLATAYDEEFTERLRKCQDRQKMIGLLKQKLQQEQPPATDAAAGSSPAGQTEDNSAEDPTQVSEGSQTSSSPEQERPTKAEKDTPSAGLPGSTTDTAPTATQEAPAQESSEAASESVSNTTSAEDSQQDTSGPAVNQSEEEQSSHTPGGEDEDNQTSSLGSTEQTSTEQGKEQSPDPQQAGTQDDSTGETPEPAHDESRYAPPQAPEESSGEQGSETHAQQESQQEPSGTESSHEPHDESRYAPPQDAEEDHTAAPDNETQQQEAGQPEQASTTDTDTSRQQDEATGSTEAQPSQGAATETATAGESDTTPDSRENTAAAQNRNETNERPQPAAQAQPLRLKTYGRTPAERLHKHWLEFCYMIKTKLQGLRMRLAMPASHQVAQKKVKRQLPEQADGQEEQTGTAETSGKQQEQLTDISRPTPPRTAHAPWIRAGYVELLAGTGVGIILGVVIAFIL